ncbi:MAG: chemotaxis protein CheW [Pseudomonadota bacterium]|uniref:chemotaxis protein CheW n=1 Tax=Phenylobacterium sp. TaxID=1871053 RepID=UPI00271BD7CD|nr:chemotaxis protein CheW [Phenylobacterium sp.]MDO9430797.1 chemotaxis protein CheW [Phenylobacterium sp.]
MADHMNSAAAELISVRIGGQQFALDIMAVREIRGWSASTPVPHAPSYVVGMINLRGVVLAVVDLSARLGLGACQPDSSSVVVVAHINDVPVGLLVDAVCDIIAVTEDMVQPPPGVGTDEVREFVQGIISTDEGIVTLLCLDQVLPVVRAAA